MVFNTTFNYFSYIVAVSFIGGGSGENHRPIASHWQTVSHTKNVMLYLYTSPLSRFELTTSVVEGTDYIGSCKSNYHMIMATMAPIIIVFTCFSHLSL